MNRQLNRFLIISGFVAVITMCVSISLSYLPLSRIGAQTSQPSAKAAMKMGNIAVQDALLSTGSRQSGWQTVMAGTMKTSQQKDMVITCSMEVGLYTKTLVASKLGVSDTSMDTAGVEARVIIDEGTPSQRVALPGDVTMGRRMQQLTATFQGLIDGCLTVDATTGAVVIDPTCVKPETLDLITDTMNAATFVFGLPDLGAGVHTVKMQTRMSMNTTVQTGQAEARTLIGKGSMEMEEVRWIKGADVTF